MELSRREFLKNLGIGVAGAIVAPTLAETVAVNTKKYFHIGGSEHLYDALHSSGADLWERFEIRPRIVLITNPGTGPDPDWAQMAWKRPGGIYKLYEGFVRHISPSPGGMMRIDDYYFPEDSVYAANPGEKE